MIITDEIKKFISDYSRMTVDEITEDTVLTDELGIDSLTFVRMVNAAETVFDVVIEDEQLPGVKTVGAFVRLLQH